MSCTAESLRVTHINLTDPDPIYVAGAVNATTPLWFLLFCFPVETFIEMSPQQNILLTVCVAVESL